MTTTSLNYISKAHWTLILLVVIHFGHVASHDNSGSVVTINDLIQSWKGIIAFFDKHQDGIIMDGLYGLFTSKGLLITSSVLAILFLNLQQAILMEKSYTSNYKW